ncbi:S49 family peptidase [Massilia sp. YMA4]|uniref:S49 family peptidase n=1 Tax=[Empedobacter] haloabium TaxID=592317 RepID=A0ABZ1URK3_9BURK|nr:S49 family peptidase [Massilia sp. YMA4]
MNFARRTRPTVKPSRLLPLPRDDALLARLVEEIAAQRHLQEMHLQASAERDKRERRWHLAGRAFVVALPVGLALFAYASAVGFQLGPFETVNGVVHIDGEIGTNSQASADRIIRALKQAFENSNVKDVYLAIDSPGGAPVEAERIGRAVHLLKTRYRKPVVAVISNVGASAAYMIALEADSIIAGKYSLVGSIGAVMAPWQLNRAMERIGVTQRVYASGKLKSFLNPFAPVSPEAERKAQELVSHAGATFMMELQRRRGARLKVGTDYSTGEVWTGLQAKEIGLVDSVGTIDELTAASGKPAYNFGPHPSQASIISQTLAEALRDVPVAQAIERPPVLR